VVKEVLTAYLNLYRSSVKTVFSCVIITCDKFIGFQQRIRRHYNMQCIVLVLMSHECNDIEVVTSYHLRCSSVALM
jgi:hypothetical protein